MVLNDICEFIVDCPHSTAPNEDQLVIVNT